MINKEKIKNKLKDSGYEIPTSKDELDVGHIIKFHNKIGKIIKILSG